MLNRGSYFSGQSRDEKVILFRKRHWITFLPWVFVSIFLLTAVPIVVYYTIVDYFMDISSFEVIFRQKPAVYWLIIIYTSWILSVFAIFLYAWMNYYLNTTIITAEHLVDIRQNGWFNHKVAEQSLLRVQDVSANMRGIFQTAFKYGKVVVETAGDTPNFEIPSIPKPYRVANVIMKLHQNLVENNNQQSSIVEAEGDLKPRENTKVASKIVNNHQKSVSESIVDITEIPFKNDDEDNGTNGQSHKPSHPLEGDLEEGKIIKL